MRTLLFLVLLAAAAPAQNLLSWNGWTPWNAQYVTNLTITQAGITFVPFKPGPLTNEVCGIEQQITVPADGTYQLHMIGGGGNSGPFSASWQIQGQTFGFRSDWQQHTWSIHLAAGTATLRLQTNISNFTNDPWVLQQPELLPATAPTADVELVQMSNQPKAEFTTEAEYVVLGFTTWAPLRIPGIMGTLDVNPIIVFPAPVSFDPDDLLGVSWPAFYLQALALTPSPRLGSLLAVQPWSF